MILLNFVFANAQDYKTDISDLLEQANTDFKNITGAKKSEEDGVVLYTCSQNSVFGDAGDIFKDTKTGTTIYYMLVNYNSSIEALVKQLDEYIKQKFPEPIYSIIRDEDDGYEELLVFSDYLDPAKRREYLGYIIATDPKTQKKTFDLRIYGVSAQKIAYKK